MKTNCWILLGTLFATAAVAQLSTNNLPEIPAPATSAAPAATAPAASETTKPAEPVKAKPAPKKKKRVVKKINEPAVTLVPGPATVTSPNLNVRGQAGLKGEVIAHLKKGDTVTVLSQINLDKHALDEPAQWAEILLPADVKVWVYAHYVDAATKTITANRLNMRSGPGENYSVLGTLEKGQSINEVSKKGNWIEIQPPATAFGFVAAMYLEQTPATVAAATTPPPAEPAMTAPPATVQPAPVMAMTPPPAQPGAVTQTPPPETAMNNIATGPAVEPVIETEPPTNLPPRVVSHEGRVRSSLSPVAPTAYELYDPATRNTINYLYTSSTNLDLSRYDGAEIIVTGEEGLAPRWKETPVLTIQRIYVVDAHPVVAYDKLQSPRASQQKIRGNQAMQRH